MYLDQRGLPNLKSEGGGGESRRRVAEELPRMHTEGWFAMGGFIQQVGADHTIFRILKAFEAAPGVLARAAVEM